MEREVTFDTGLAIRNIGKDDDILVKQVFSEQVHSGEPGVTWPGQQGDRHL